MDLGLSGRTALVFGASSGLGLASAEALAAEGANVTLVGRRRDLLERVGRDRGARSGCRPAGVPDEDVEAAERLERRRDGAVGVLWEGHVSTYGERADSVCLTLELVAAPCEHRHVRSFGGECLGGCEPEPG